MRITRAFRCATTGVAGALLAGSMVLVPSLSVAAVSPASAAAAAPAPKRPAVAPAEVPQADVLDVDLADGTLADRAQELAPTLQGEPVFSADAMRARSVVSFDGAKSSAQYPFAAEHAKLAEGFSVECTFRYDGPSTPTSEKAICSAKEGGGFATVANSAGITFMAHIGGGYKRVSTGLEPGQWYHTVATWDGEQISLHVNGELVGTAPAAGAYQPPTGGADSVVLGGDTQPGDAVGFWAPVSVQNARVHSRAVTAEEVTALNTAATEVPDAPEADVFDVDFTGGTATDQAGGLEPQEFNTPEIVDYGPLGRSVGRFDGSSAYYYEFSSKYAMVEDQITVECFFKYDADFEPDGGERRGNLCASKEAGGFAIVQYGDKLSFNPHIGGSYRNTAVQLEHTDRWYHVVGTYDGSQVRLYVDGALAASRPASGKVSSPTETARMMVIGGDASKNKPAFFAPAHVATARVFSRAVGLDEVLALQAEAHGERDATDLVRLTSSTPAAGERITSAVTLDLEFENAEAMGRDVAYRLDGETVTPGEPVGAGLSAGRHTLTVDGTDHFGNVIAERVEFSSGNIPSGGGTETGQGDGKVTLSAIATNPSGGKVTTTFRRADVVAAREGVQGTFQEVPTTLDFSTPDQEPIEEALVAGDDLFADSPSAEHLSYQRFDVEVDGESGQQVSWSGSIDPTRSVSLRLWNGVTWKKVDEARGQATGGVTLSGKVRAGNVVDGTVPILLVAEDPFADDFDKEVADGFEDPESYDFAIAHLTDTQYLSEGAVEQETPEERAKWKEAYTSITQWIADNAARRKIAFATHTGDVIENYISASDFTPGYLENAKAEFEVASEAQRILDEAGVVNSVLPGNHDNRSGTETGPDALYNDYFGPERFNDVAAQESWQTSDASYHPWKEGDSANSYILFTASGIDFIAVNLGYGVDDEEAAWANAILEKYKDRNAIVQTHAHVAPSTNPDGRGGSLSYDGNKVRNQVAAKNPNVFLVLSGHEHGVNIEVVRNLGEKGNNVVELLADYQFYKVGAGELGLSEIAGYDDDTPLQFGSSFFRLLQIDVDRAEMSVDTYSALLDNYGATEYDDRHRYDGREDDFKLPIQLETRRTSLATDALSVVQPTDDVIGTETTRSGWPAEVVWDGLEAGETYAWYATSADAESGEELPGEVSQLNIFTAQATGTDVTAPTITMPEETSIMLGADFDPFAEVSAEDDTDGDVSERLQVAGEVNPQKLGTYTLVYTATDANGNQATATRTVEVTPHPAPVNTAAPAITGKPEKGELLHASMGEWENVDEAEMRIQWFRDGVAIDGADNTEWEVTKADLGRTLTVAVSAKVKGHDRVVVRSAAFEVSQQAAKAATRTKVKAKQVVRAGKRVKVKVAVKGKPTATGKVRIKVDGATRRTVRLNRAGKVMVNLGKLKVGKHRIKVRYLGDDAHKRSAATTRVTVRRR